MKIHVVPLLSLFLAQVSAQISNGPNDCESLNAAYQECATEVQNDPLAPENYSVWCTLAWSTLVRPDQEYDPVTCKTYCEYFQIRCIPCQELAESMYNCYAGEECDASDCEDDGTDAPSDGTTDVTNDGGSNAPSDGTTDVTNGDSSTEICPKVSANVETSFLLRSDQAGCQPHPYLGTCVPCFTTPGTSLEIYKVTVTNDVPGRFSIDTANHGGFAWGEDSAGAYTCSGGDEQILLGEFVEGSTVNVLVEVWDIPECQPTTHSGYVKSSASTTKAKVNILSATVVAAALSALESLFV